MVVSFIIFWNDMIFIVFLPDENCGDEKRMRKRN